MLFSFIVVWNLVCKGILEENLDYIHSLKENYLALPKSFYTARRTITGYETMNQIRKGQVCGVAKGDTLGQVKFIAQFLE